MYAAGTPPSTLRMLPVLLPERASRGEVEHRLGDVLGQDVDAERRAVAVVLLELVGLDAVGRGALLAPRRVPDPRALQHRVRVDRVDADAVAAALLGQAAREVQLGGLGRRVRRGVLAGDERVLGGDEDDEPPRPWRSTRERLARDQEVAGDEDRVVALATRRASSPRSARSTRRRRWRRRCRRRRSARRRRANAAAHGVLARDVAADGQAVVAEAGDRRRRAPSPSRSKATTHAPAAASASTIARPMPPAPPVTSATAPCSSPGGGASESL